MAWSGTSPVASAGGPQNFERRDVPFFFVTADNPDQDFDPPSDADFAAHLEVWRAECVLSRGVVATHDLR